MAGVLIGALVAILVVGVPICLIFYLLARAFGLGRTQGVINLVACLLFLLVMVVVGRNPLLAARRAAENARAAAEANGGGVPNPAAPRAPGVVNGPAGGMPGNPVPAMGGRLALAMINGKFETHVLRETNVGDIKISVASIGMVGDNATVTELHIFQPNSNALADEDGNRPCILIAPGGSNSAIVPSTARTKL